MRIRIAVGYRIAIILLDIFRLIFVLSSIFILIFIFIASI